MVEVSVTYEGDLSCTATHGPSGSSFRTDAPVDNRGKGRSFSPTDLVGTAMGTCMVTIMGIRAEENGWDITGTRVTVKKHMAKDPHRRIGRLEVEIAVPRDPGPEARASLEEAALTCPVHRSLRSDVEVPLTFKWGE